MIDFTNHIFKKCHLTENSIEYIKNNYSIFLREFHGSDLTTLIREQFIGINEYLSYIESIPYYHMVVKYKCLDYFDYIPYKLTYNIYGEKVLLLFYFLKK